MRIVPGKKNPFVRIVPGGTGFCANSPVTIQPRGKGRKPLGDKLLMSTESPYDFDHLLQASNKSSWILILYTFFNVFPHIYSPGAGADNHLWTKFWCQQKGLVTLPICCKFQKIPLKSNFIHNFACFLHVYSPGAGADNPLGSEFLF